MGYKQIGKNLSFADLGAPGQAWCILLAESASHGNCPFAM